MRLRAINTDQANLLLSTEVPVQTDAIVERLSMNQHQSDDYSDHKGCREDDFFCILKWFLSDQVGKRNCQVNEVFQMVKRGIEHSGN